MTAMYRCTRCHQPLTGTETACPKCALPMTPATSAPNAPSSIEVRRYESVAAFQSDAGTMAAVGWSPVAQSETTGGMSAGWIVWAILLLLGGFLIHYVLLLGAVIAAVLAVGSRRKAIVVTYRPDALR